MTPLQSLASMIILGIGAGAMGYLLARATGFLVRFTDRKDRHDG